MHKITGVKVLKSYRLELVFVDGVRGIVDLSDLVGKGVFTLWHDYRAFEQVRIGSSGELVWGDQVDLCPDALYLRTTGKRPEDVFPAAAHIGRGRSMGDSACRYPNGRDECACARGSGFQLPFSPR